MIRFHAKALAAMGKSGKNQRPSAGTKSALSAGNFFPQIAPMKTPQICAERIVASMRILRAIR